MMPQKKTAAIDSRIVAVRRLAARRGLTPMSGCIVSAKLVPYFTTGGVSNVWYGAGDGNVHSSVSAPSHGRAGAGAPLRIVFRTATRSKNCDRPNPNAPIDATTFQSVNRGASCGPRGGSHRKPR